MTYRKSLSIKETFAFSTSATALQVLKYGSNDLLIAFKHGAFEESDAGITLRTPNVSVGEIEEIGTALFLLQLNALVAEMASLGIEVKEYKRL